MLPTENYTNSTFGYIKRGECLHLFTNGEDPYHHLDNLAVPQHLYFTTDEDTKEGDWVYSDEREYGIFKWDEKCPLVVRKIISSTDPKLYTPLGPDDVNIFDIPFPQPSQSFIEKYCKLGGIDEVDVEYVYHKVWDKQTEELLEKYITLKVDSNNEITIHAIEEMW